MNPDNTRCSCSTRPDRYVSFKGIDCDGNARRRMELLDALRTDDPDERALLARLRERRSAARSVQCDDLLLLASFVNPIRDLCERRSHGDAVALLEQLEQECF